MKQSPQDRDLSSLLGPSKFSAEGFLGSDTRAPEEIIAEDQRTLGNLGVGKTDLVVALKTIYDEAERAFGAQTTVTPNLTATYYESRGKIPSPFRGDGMFAKGEVEVTDNRSGKKFILTSLSINLIEKHDFFQGRGSRYRIEPSEIVASLELIRKET